MAKLEAGHVHAIIRKPFDVAQIVTMIREVTAMWHAQTAPAAVERSLPELFADDHMLPAEPTN